MTDLGALIAAAERGEFPPADLGVTAVPAANGKTAVLGFTGHTVVAADIDPAWLAEHLPPGDPGLAFNPPFLARLEARLDLQVSNIDILTLAPPRSGPPSLPLRRIDDQSHPRVRRALRYRDDVTVWACDGGVLSIGRGLAGRWEVGLEVAPDYRGKGLGRAMAAAAAHLVPDDRPIWAEIGVGNAASVRAFLSVGYLPIGEEALLVGR